MCCDETVIKNSKQLWKTRILTHSLNHSDLIKYLDCLNLSSWKNSNSFFLTWIRLNLFKIISASSRSNLRLFDFPFITKCVDFYYKVRQSVFQSVVFITKWVVTEGSWNLLKLFTVFVWTWDSGEIIKTLRVCCLIELWKAMNSELTKTFSSIVFWIE